MIDEKKQQKKAEMSRQEKEMRSQNQGDGRPEVSTTTQGTNASGEHGNGDDEMIDDDGYVIQDGNLMKDGILVATGAVFETGISLEDGCGVEDSQQRQWRGFRHDIGR